MTRKSAGLRSLFAFVDEAAVNEDWPRVVAILHSYRDDKSSMTDHFPRVRNPLAGIMAQLPQIS
jgi:hypothetical protein